MNARLGESLFESQYTEHNLSKNLYWRRGVEEFVEKLVKGSVEILQCPFCYSYTLIPGELFPIADNTSEFLQCLSCFQYLDYGRIL